MNPESSIDSSPDLAAPAAPAAGSMLSVASAVGSPGQQIRGARERARLSLEELARQTKLNRPTLDALERDDFGVLTEPVYVRGYYRKIAKALDLSEQSLLAGYQALVVPKAPPAPTKLLLGGGDNGPERTRRRSGGGWSWLLAAIVILALLLLGLRLLRHTPDSAEPPAITGSAATEHSDASDTGAQPLSSSSAAAPLTTAPLSAAPAGQTPVDGQTRSSELPTQSQSQSQSDSSGVTAETAAAVTPGPDSLSLNFKSTSWVRIEDADNKVLLSGVIQDGDQQVLTGKPPYSVFLGNAPGVNVAYHGKAFDVGPYVKDNATARFSVP